MVSEWLVSKGDATGAIYLDDTFFTDADSGAVAAGVSVEDHLLSAALS